MKLSSMAGLFAAAFGICVCATAYAASDLTASQVDEATLQITGPADAHANPQTIRHHVLMRAAEETSDRGFDLFLLLPSPENLHRAASAVHSEDSVLVM